MTYQQIADELGISKQRAKQIFDIAMRKLANPKTGKILRPYLTN